MHYQEQLGTLSVIKKLDRGFALLAHLFCVGNKITIHGKVPAMADFLYQKPKPVEVCTDINQAFAFLKSVKKNGD